MTKVEVDREQLMKASKEAEALAGRVSYNTGDEFYQKASQLSALQIREYGLNARRLIMAVRQLIADATQHTEGSQNVPGVSTPLPESGNNTEGI